MSDQRGEPGAAITVGVFDGVHRGHQQLIGQMVEEAGRDGLRVVVVTFDPHPDAVIRPAQAPLALSSIESRRSQLQALGVHDVDVMPFTREVAHQSPSEFVDRLRALYPLRMLWAGPDFALGHDRAGNLDMLGALGRERGFEVRAVDPLLHEGRAISSTWVREALTGGDVALAATLLGRTYCVEGQVVAGKRRGREIGFPTANVIPPHGRALPSDGVYFVRAERMGVEQEYFGVMNLGGRPTFGESERILETHLFDFDGDLYDEWLHVCFVEQLRGVQRFPSLEALRDQIERDVARGRSLARRDVPSPLARDG